MVFQTAMASLSSVRTSLEAAADTSKHSGTIPLLVVALGLFVAAVIVRKLIKLAIVVVVAGIVVLVIAGWRAGTFS